MRKLFSFGKTNYNNGLSSVMSVFTKALKKAQELVAKMVKEIEANNEEIKSLEERNAEIEVTRQSTEKFIENLNKLLNKDED